MAVNGQDPALVQQIDDACEKAAAQTGVPAERLKAEIWANLRASETPSAAVAFDGEKVRIFAEPYSPFARWPRDWLAETPAGRFDGFNAQRARARARGRSR